MVKSLRRDGGRQHDTPAFKAFGRSDVQGRLLTNTTACPQITPTKPPVTASATNARGLVSHAGMTEPLKRICKRCPCASTRTYCSHCRKGRTCPATRGQAGGNVPPDRGGQSQRAIRDAKADLTRQALEAIPVYVPFAGATPDGLPAFAYNYLVALSELGREYVAASKAKVRPRDVRALVRASRDFSEECKVAHGFYSDTLEVKLAFASQVAGPIVVMKRRRPGQFLEPALINQVIVNEAHTTTLHVEADARVLLANWRDDVTDATLALIDGGKLSALTGAESPAAIIDVESAPA